MSRFVLTAQLQLQAPNNVAQVVRQIQSQLNNVSVNVQVQGSAQAQRQLQQVTAQTQAATSAVDRMGRAFAVSVRRFAAFSIATRAVGLFTSTLSDAVKTAIDFEREMVRVSQVTGESLTQLKGFAKTVTNLSTSLGVASSDLVQAGQLLLQAGISAKDTEVALKTLAKAALAPNFDSLSETTEGAIAILAQFGQGVGALEKQLGSINAVAGAFAVEAGDLIDVIRRAGGVFKSSGGDLNELIALFTSVRATTRESAESIGTGLRTIFTRIQRPKTIEFLKQFGVELLDLEGKFVGPFEAVKRLSGALAGLGEGDVTFIRIAEELGGFRQIGKVLPLLQQFSVAQNALNVANKAGNSLTNDAATAQQALAIRIIKVKEEFLALIRGITETSTFQIMANTALALASALIKIGEAIKPLLPMLATLAAVNLARGIGPFLGSFARGMSSNRTFNKGGKVHHFARGGFVPGSGNRDTVPAMLSPGEFVIRKSSVKKLGASNLAAMNENRFANGTTGRGIVGATSALKSVSKRKTPYGPKESVPGQGNIQFDVNSGQIGAFVLSPAKGTEGSYNASGSTPFTILPSDKGFARYQKMISSSSGLTKEDLKGGINAVINKASYPIFYPGMNEGRANLAKNANYANAVHKGFNDSITAGINSTIQNSKGLLDIPPAFDTDENLIRSVVSKIQSDNQVRSTIEGYLFEGMISAFTGASAAGGTANFDFPRSAISQNKNKLAALFGSPDGINKLVKAEAKRSYGEVGTNIQRKLANDIKNGFISGVTLRKSGNKATKAFATGGGVGTDTVPALLTPGEFVVNRSSAQRIGYGNLNRMNKVGRYAKGGVVQRFAVGGAVGDSAVATARTTDAIMASMSKKDIALVKMAMKNNADIFDKVTKELQDMLYMEKEVTAGYKALARSLRAGDTAEKAYQQALEAAEASLTESNKGKTTARTPQKEPFTEENIIQKTKGMTKQEKMGMVLEGKAQKGQLTNKDLGQALGSGMSQAQAKAIAATNLQAQASQKAAQASQQAASADTHEAAQSQKAAMADATESKASAQNFGNLAMGLSMVSGTIQAMLPPLDENSGLLLQMAHGILGLITTITGVGFALSAFGVNLSASTLASAASTAASFLMGTAGAIASTATLTLAGSATAAAAATGGLAAAVLTATSTILVAIAPLVGVVTTLLGPIVAVAGAALLAAVAFRKIYDSIYDFDGRLKTSISKGDVEETRRIATEKVQANNNPVSAKSLGTIAAATATGAALGSVIPVIGTFAGALFGLSVGIATVSSGATTSARATVALAVAQAGAVKVTKTLEATQKAGTVAMEKFNNGLISSSELLNTYAPAFKEVADQNTRVLESVQANAGTRSEYGSGKILRNLGAYLGGGLFGMETAGTRNARLEKESVEGIQTQRKAITETFAQSREARNAAMRSAIFRGEDPQALLKSKGMDTASMQTQVSKLRIAASEADQAGRTKEAEELRATAALYEEEIKNNIQAQQNLVREVEIAKAKFNALNLGLRSVTAAADASALRMSKAMNSFDLAVVPGTNAIATLEASLTAAGQNISKGEFDASLSEVSNIMRKFGANAEQVGKFEDLTKGVATVQREFPNIFETLKQRLESGELKKMSPEDLGNEFKKIVGESLDKAGIGPAAKQRIMDSMGDVKIDPEDMAKIMAGDISVLEKYVGDAAEEVAKNIKAFGEKWISANQELIKATQERIEAERNLVAAQREAVDLYMEGRDIQAKYGGQAVSTQERRGAILAKANAGAARMGLGQMRTGSVAELRARNNQILTGFGGIEANRGGAGSEMGAAGADLQGTQQNLQQAQKDQIQTIRDLIKLEEEELKIIQEKNKLEKDSLESLITGDIEKFFEQQAAVGAQAAIATGDTSLANMFGAKAIGTAFQDIQRMQEAGVQSLFGRQLAGPGGLTEQAAGAALGARGVMDPRMAQRLAGTTAEEEATKARLRELGGVLGEAGAVGAAMAEMQVQTAQMKIDQANLVISNLETGGAPATGMYRGGTVYASRGIFVPRGTDTVPAMLTPGEFVVRREAVNRGNNLQLLRAINNGGNAGGFARGGKVGYYNNGGIVQYKALGDLIARAGQAIGIDPKVITNLGNVFTSFTNTFNQSIKNLQDTKLQVKLDSVNVNVNLNGTSMLTQLTEETRKQIMSQVITKIQNEYSVGPNGKLIQNTSGLAKPGQGA